MTITEESTRFIFRDYSADELAILRRLVSADDKSFLYEDKDFVACPIGIENYIKKKFPEITIEKNEPWDADKMKFIPQDMLAPRNKLQKDALKFLSQYKTRSQLGLITSVGSGKEQPYSTKIPTPTGIALMGDLKIGDKVFDRNGKPTTVTGIFEQGVKDVYQITFSDGRTAECGLEHLWNVQTADGRDWTLELQDIINDYAVPVPDAHGKSEYFYKYSIPINQSVDYPMRPVLTDPIAIGRSIANGCYDTAIPDNYIFNDSLVRMRLIEGIVDITSGCDHCCEMGQIKTGKLVASDTLMKQVQYIIWSLGGIAQIIHDENTGEGTLDWTISCTDHPGEMEPRLTIKDIQLVRQEKCRCIMVDNSEHLYLTEDFIVTHNTFMSIRHAIAMGMKTLVICPSTSILQQWLDSLKDMFDIPEKRILFVSSPAKMNNCSGDYDWVLVLEQSLQAQLSDYKLEGILKQGKFGMKIIDEIHMFLKNNIAIDCCSNIRNGLYLTGTFFRTQEEESNLFRAVYHNILRFEVVEQGELERYGQAKHVEIYSVVIDSKLTRREVSHIVINAKLSRRRSTKVVSIGRYMQTVCPEDPQKVTVYMQQCLAICKRMRERVDYGRMLVLVPSINATKRFRAMLADIFPKLKVGAINSTQPRSLNTRVKQEADIVVSTAKSCGVGFDMKDLAILVAVEQFRSAVLVEQISGRLRPRQDKKSTFYVDIADKSLGRHLMAWRDDRLELLKKKAKVYRTFSPPASDK